ncbi:MAG TPA: hypothetical protein VMJ65_30390 [Solirubrobacteraceae bacterium]|nr:hypothetical protein [Solirubrobacteraceae bacterium]
MQSAFWPQTEHERVRAAAAPAAQPSYILRDGTAVVSAEPNEDLAGGPQASGPAPTVRLPVVSAGGHEQAGPRSE